MKTLNRENAHVTDERPVKILQFGTGNFLRGFVDWAIDIINEKTEFNGDVQIVQPHGKRPAAALNEQEGLFHVITRGFQEGRVVEEERLITCVRSAVNPYLEYDQYLDLASNPDLTVMISNTTEAGIHFAPKDTDKTLMPASFPGKLTALLYRRFSVFNGDPSKGLIHLPCELIEENGEKLRKTILQYSELWKLGTGFEDWIKEHNSFCNTLVDRIVPGFPEENAEQIQEKIGYKDELMVMTEPFHLWVIDGPQALEELFQIEKTGLDIIFVKDLSPYRTRKVRILNGAHTSLVPYGYLKGCRTVRESVEDPAIGKFLTQTIEKEIIPTLDLPKQELDQFALDVLERFKNPFIKHQLKDIALNSVSKFKVRVLPSLLEYHKRAKQLPENLVLSFAALIVFYKGIYRGETLPVRDTDEVLAFFRKEWEKEDIGDLVHSILSHSALWDQDLSKVEGLSRSLSEKVKTLLKEEQTSS